jgi:hypothetical protein
LSLLKQLCGGDNDRGVVEGGDEAGAGAAESSAGSMMLLLVVGMGEARRFEIRVVARMRRAQKCGVDACHMVTAGLLCVWLQK